MTSHCTSCNAILFAGTITRVGICKETWNSVKNCSESWVKPNLCHFKDESKQSSQAPSKRIVLSIRLNWTRVLFSRFTSKYWPLSVEYIQKDLSTTQRLRRDMEEPGALASLSLTHVRYVSQPCQKDFTTRRHDVKSKQIKHKKIRELSNYYRTPTITGLTYQHGWHSSLKLSVSSMLHWYGRQEKWKSSWCFPVKCYVNCSILVSNVW